MQHFLISRGIELPDPGSAGMIFFDLIVHVGTLISIANVFRRSLKTYLENIIAGFWEWISGERTATGHSAENLRYLDFFRFLLPE